jgi:transketolase
MDVHSIFIFTHDSIALGEDGPTHQPVEQILSLRAIPRLTVIRPCDANETAAAWRIAMERRGPVALALTRQALPILDPDRFPTIEGTAKGGYVLSDAEGRPDLVLIATGSEVHLALDAQKKLRDESGIGARVVSMPSWELFLSSRGISRRSSADVKRVAIGRIRWVGLGRGQIIIGVIFGTSAPGWCQTIQLNIENADMLTWCEDGSPFISTDCFLCSLARFRSQAATACRGPKRRNSRALRARERQSHCQSGCFFN